MVKKQSKPFPVRGRVQGELERISKKQWLAIKRAAAAIRGLGSGPLTKEQAAKLAKKLIDESGLKVFSAIEFHEAPALVNKLLKAN